MNTRRYNIFYFSIMLFQALICVAWCTTSYAQTGESKSLMIKLSEESPSPKVMSRNLMVEIGDSTAADFVPQFTITAWSRECSLKIGLSAEKTARFDNPSPVLVSGQRGMAVHQNGLGTHQMYPRPDGSFEWEVILDSMPQSQPLKFPIENSGLEFLYQPPLTQSEIDTGIERPDSVIGSYAVYFANHRGNHITVTGSDTLIEEYQTGKAFHIYRPRAHDSRGWAVWCDIKIDSILAIFIPGEFLKSAIYPITIDPTYGNTAVGASTAYISGSACQALSGNASYRYPASGGDVITSYSIYCLTYSSPSYVGFAAYTFAGGNPADRLASPVQLTVTNGAMQWNTTSTVSQALNGGTTYVVAYGEVSPTSGSIRARFDTESNICSVHNNVALPSSWVHSTFVSNRWSLYATYTSGSPAKSTRRRNIIVFQNQGE